MTKTGSHAQTRRPLAVVTVSALAGLVFVSAAVSSDGSELRPSGGDVASLLVDRSERLEARRTVARDLRNTIDQLSSATLDKEVQSLLERVDKLRIRTGLSTHVGPGVRVTLTDAPRSVNVPGLNPNLLIVHQQDIQAFVNALWAGGAEAITLQGQRLISTTGIKCVGNTVVLDGVPYSPPYVIEAIGDRDELGRALEASPAVATYRDYADRYQLGLKVEEEPEMTAQPYAGTVGLAYAKVVQP